MPTSCASMAPEQPDTAAIVYDGRTTSYGALDRASSQVANALIADGVRPQRRVAHLDKSSDLFFELLFGAAKANAVMVSVNWRLAPPEVAAHRQRRRGRDSVRRRGVLPGDREDPRRAEDRPQDRGARRRSPGWEPFAAWRDRQPATDPRLPIEPGDTAVQFYTSGTTGLPKGAELTNAQLRVDDAAVDPGVAAGAGRAQPGLPADVPYRRRRLGHRRPVRGGDQPRHARVRAGADPRDRRSASACR